MGVRNPAPSTGRLIVWAALYWNFLRRFLGVLWKNDLYRWLLNYNLSGQEKRVRRQSSGSPIFVCLNLSHYLRIFRVVFVFKQLFVVTTEDCWICLVFVWFVVIIQNLEIVTYWICFNALQWLFFLIPKYPIEGQSERLQMVSCVLLMWHH